MHWCTCVHTAHFSLDLSSCNNRNRRNFGQISQRLYYGIILRRYDKAQRNKWHPFAIDIAFWKCLQFGLVKVAVIRGMVMKDGKDLAQKVAQLSQNFPRKIGMSQKINTIIYLFGQRPR